MIPQTAQHRLRSITRQLFLMVLIIGLLLSGIPAGIIQSPAGDKLSLTQNAAAAPDDTSIDWQVNVTNVDPDLDAVTDVEVHPSKDEIYVTARTTTTMGEGHLLVYNHSGSLLRDQHLNYLAFAVKYQSSRDSVIVGGQGNVSSHAPDTLSEEWRFNDANDISYIDIAVGDGGDIYAAGQDGGAGQMLAVNGADGTKKASLGSADYTSVAYDSNSDTAIFADSTNAVIIGRNPSDLSGRWSVSPANTPRSVTTFDGQVFGGSTTGDLINITADASSASIEWERSISGVTGRIDELEGIDSSGLIYGADATDQYAFGVFGDASVQWTRSETSTVFNIGASDYEADDSAFVPLGNASLQKLVADQSYVSEVTVNGTVTNQNGDPVSGATVKAAAVNFSHPDIDAPTTSETEENARQYLRDLIPDVPTDLQDQRSSSFSLSGSTGFVAQQDSNVGLLHSRDDLNTAQLSVMPDSADLSNPQWQGIAPNERQVVTCWDPTETGGIGGTGVGQNEYNTQNPGTHQSDCTVEFTQLAGVDDINTVSVEMDQTSRTTTLDPSTLHYGLVSLPAGWYRVSTSESDASYVVQVGDPTQAIYEDLKNNDGIRIPSAQEVVDGQSEDKFEMKTVTADASGQFSITFQSTNLKTVGVQAYKYPGSNDPMNVTLDTMRDDANAGSLNQSVYLPSKVYTEDVPAKDLNIKMEEVSWETYGNLTSFQSRMAALMNAIENGSFSDLPAPLQQRLNNMTRESLEETFAEMDDLRKQNQRLEDAYKRSLERSGGDTTVNVNPDDASRDDLERRIQALQQSMTQLQSDVNSGEPSVNTGNETVSLTFPFDADLSEENVLVRAHFNNGTSRTLNTSSGYVSIDQRIGGDAVKITDYPLGSGDAALADFEVDVATSDGTGSSSRAVTNPTFSGDIPSLSAVEFSTLRPGPDELVSVDVHPEDVGKFDQLKAATIYAPDGSKVSTSNITDDGFEFTTAGAGKHRVELTFTNPGGVEFTEIVYLGAGDKDQNWPASVRAASGPTGVFALVGDGLESGSIDVKQGGTEVDISATIPKKADAPTDLHVYTEALETAPDTTTRVSVVRGDQESSIQKHIPVTVHGPTIGENALVYRNDKPLPRGDGNQYGVVKVKGNKTVYKTITSDQGTVSLRVSADPGLLERAQHWVSLRTPDISLPGMSIFPEGSPTPALGGIALVGFAVVSRRRFL